MFIVYDQNTHEGSFITAHELFSRSIRPDCLKNPIFMA